jgi:tape measure domain-containing protein
MAELKLRVSLDTSYLKGQISRLPLEFAGANVSIRPKFDRQTIVNEFRLLNRYIGSKKFNIVINTNLNKEIENADRLVKALGRVQQAASGAKGGLPIGTQVLSRTKTKGGFAAAEIKALFGAAVQGGLIDDKTLAATRAQMVAALGSIGKDSIAGLLNGLKSGDADIQAAAQMLGSNLITSFKTVLGIASPSKEFKKLGEAAGQGFEQGLLKSIEIAEQSATRKMQRMLDRLARMALIMSGMSGPEIGRQIAQARGLPSLNFSATTPRASIGIGPSSSGRMLPAAPSRTAIAGTPAPAGLLPALSSAGRSKAIIEALIASTGPRLLPSGGGDNSLGKLAAPRQTKDAVDAILRNYFKVVEAQVREVFSAPPIKKESLNIFDHLDTEQYFNYLAQARINAENAIKQSIEEAKQVTRRNQIKDAAQSFLRALEETVRNAERSVFVQSRIAANQSYVQKANIREIGQPLLGGRQVVAPKMLSAATGFYRGAAVPPPLPETQTQLFARREREARMRSALRGLSVSSERGLELPGTTFMGDDFTRGGGRDRVTGSGQPREKGGALAFLGGGMGPSSQLGAGYFAVGKGLKDIESAYGQAKKFLNTKNLPVTGAIADLGGEFGNAIKQVLLFGTAYKALAFLTSLPGEAFEAAKGLATYKNQLQAVTAESGTFEQSFAFVDGLATRFNVPLDSARQGFVKLYASMQPAGFDQGQIENLFTGISKAAAAFGLSSDKVDRVNYAFAQMASKGQIMSEELKGQLGDVLPGALGLFAKAAQMSIPEFSKAMEDGAFKGKAMEQVLGNVATLLNDKFGTAAEGAAKTLQGAVNQIQNNLALMYQSFSPIVDGVAAAFGPQVNALIKDVTDTVKVLTGTFTQAGEGFNSLSPRAQGFYTAIQTLEPSLRQAGAAIADVGSRLAQLAPLFVEVLATAISFASSPLARAALVAAVAIGTLTAALKVLEVTGLKAALKAVYSFISSLAVGIPQATGIARLALIGLKLAVTGLFIGAVLVGLDLLIGKILEIGGAAQKSINDVKQLAMDLDRLAGAQDTIGLAVKRQEAENEVIIAERVLEIYQKVDRINKEGGYGYGALSAQQKTFLKQYGEKNLLGGIEVQPGVGIKRAESKLAAALEKRGMAQKSLETANRLAEDERRRRAAQTPALTKVDLSGSDGAGGARGTKTKLDTYDRSTLDFIKLRLEAEKQSLDQRRQAGLLSETAYKIAVAELELESSKEEVAEKLRLSRLAINKDNLSAADKVLKLKDMEILAERELSIATDKRNIAIEGARKELSGPFDSAIKDANFSMVEQRMLLENLQSGIEGLTAKQQAYLQVLGMTKDLSEDEFDILKDRIKLTSGAIEKEILSKQGVRQGTILNELGGQLRLAQTLDPRAELRETLRQRNPLFSNAQIEQQAVLSEQVAAAQKAKDDLKGIASAISNAFGEAFKGIVTGSMTAREALAGMFQSIADSFADMVAQMIAEWLKAQLIKGFQSLFSAVLPGLGAAAGGLSSGFSAGTSSAIDTGAAGWANSFATPLKFANGGIAAGGFTAFANGGIVTGPTLGLVGEGRYNEAVIPLPDGKSVPVDLGGAMGNQITSNIVVNVSSDGKTSSSGAGSDSAGLGRKLEGAVKQVIVDELRPGGLLSGRR